MVKVKICGITNLEDALKISQLKPDALGFVFYKKSPRYITPEKAREIIRQLPKNILKIGVFVNEKPARIKKIAKFAKLDILQFHGDETPKFCQQFKGYKIIKTFRIKPFLNADKRPDVSSGRPSACNLRESALRYKVFGYLFDTYVKTKPGGTGKKFNWELIKNIKLGRKPIFLSGGLNAQNVKVAIRLVKPDWVDASSSLEIRPGKKDYKKVRAFIEVVRGGRVILCI